MRAHVDNIFSRSVYYNFYSKISRFISLTLAATFVDESIYIVTRSLFCQNTGTNKSAVIEPRRTNKIAIRIIRARMALMNYQLLH